MPRPTTRCARTSALLLATTALLLGCEHEASRDQAQTNAALIHAEEVLFEAGSDATKLEKAVRTIRDIRGGNTRQQANRDLMLASAQVHLGQLQLIELGRDELDLQNEIMQINNLVDQAQAIHAFIDDRRINVGQL